MLPQKKKKKKTGVESPATTKTKRREGLALRGWRGGGHGGVADGVTIDDKLDAAIALAAFGRVIGGDGLRLAEAVSGNGRRGDALFGEKVANGIGAALGELLIEFI